MCVCLQGYFGDGMRCVVATPLAVLCGGESDQRAPRYAGREESRAAVGQIKDFYAGRIVALLMHKLGNGAIFFTQTEVWEA